MARFSGLLCLLLVLGSSPAYAHAPIPGIKGFYVGLLHPFSTPSQALALLGLGLLLGQFTAEKVRWQLGSFLICCLFAVILGTAELAVDNALFAVALGACTLAALLPGKAFVLALTLSGAGGLLIGCASIPDAGPAVDRVITMAGSTVGANLGLLYIWGASHFLQNRFTAPWVNIGFRVAAAWVGAVSLLMLALGYASSTQMT
ncbi:HupE/UreJ family protein [Tropicibacter sp. R16_0]|uniref:HupE/UreJ family protein n=1 Tax=Tropicibacter sp. R16_0 TaxID=2821102 RepID=UPI001ADD4A84|nr:HupE/UreJ family protein [Tropicibacter sp. R16_0]